MRQSRFGSRFRLIVELLGVLILGVVNTCSAKAIAGDSKAQSFKVLVLDAGNGKPQPKIQVEFFCSDSRRNYLPPEEGDTDERGILIIPYTCEGDEARINIDAAGRRKEQCGSSEVTATIEEISSKGIVSAPDAAGEMHCTTKISSKLKAVPGQITIFVKKPSLWQSIF